MKILSLYELKHIPKSDVPIIVLTDNLRSLLSAEIRRHTYGSYSHSMWLFHRWKVATQGWTYHAQPFEDYLRGRHRVKLWRNTLWTGTDKARIQAAINRRLAEPLYRRLYDYLGVLGHLIGRPSLNIPWRKYCSESVVGVLSEAENTAALGLTPSPADINRWAKQQPGWEVYGVYDPDLSPKFPEPANTQRKARQ